MEEHDGGSEGINLPQNVSQMTFYFVILSHRLLGVMTIFVKRWGWEVEIEKSYFCKVLSHQRGGLWRWR